MDRRTSVAMGGEDLKESENVATSNFLSIVEEDKKMKLVLQMSLKNNRFK